jgi:hypothetical protein
MSQPFVVSYKITGDGRSGVQAARDVRQEIEALQRSATQLATGRSAAGIDGMLGIGRDSRATAQAKADLDAYGAALDNLRAQFVPLFSLERQHQANLDAIAGAYKVGAISADEQAAAIARENAAHQRAIAALDGHTHAINANNAANGRAAAQRANLIFQLNDIFVSLASGMNPAMVAIQQGSQISTIYGPGEGGIGAAFRETGKLAATAVTKFWPLAVAAGAIAVAVGGMRHEIEETSGVAVSFGDTFTAVFQVLGGYLYDAFRPQILAVQEWFAWAWDRVVEGTKAAMNIMIGSVLAFVEQVRLVHDAIPLLFQIAGEAAANAFIASIEWLVQKSLEGIDGLIAGVNDFINMFGGDKLRELLGWSNVVPQLTDPNKPFTLGVKFDIEETQAELAAVGERYSQAIAEIAQTDFIGQFFGDVQQQAIANYNDRLEDTEKKAKQAAIGVNDLKEAAKAFEQEVSFYRDTFSGFFEDMRKGLMDGKSFWEALGNAGANALDRIAQRAMNMAADGLFDMIFGALIGGLTGSAPGFSYGAGVMSDPWAGLRLNAKGGVYPHPALSAFSNTIVNQPTLFAFAKGAGLMGEAGAEAIMPLTRTSSGDLGVRMVGNAGWSIHFNPVTHLTIGANAGVNQGDIEALLDERDRALMEQFNTKVMDVLDNPRRAA